MSVEISFDWNDWFPIETDQKEEYIYTDYMLVHYAEKTWISTVISNSRGKIHLASSSHNPET